MTGTADACRERMNRSIGGSFAVAAFVTGLWLTASACGGNVSYGGGGQGGSGGWDACGGKACGEGCTPCDPADPDCVLPGTPMYCDASGDCVIGRPECPGGCTSDEACEPGAEWCVGGECVPCDNSGQLCDLACADGWVLLERNGCTPCSCAPPTECTDDAACGPTRSCYAGQLCWDYCKVGDPSCCRGNFCDVSGCSEPAPGGCRRLGCPEGQFCEQIDCAPTSCDCTGGSWACSEDCGGGVCVTPL